MNIIDKDFAPKQIRKVNYKETRTKNVQSGESSPAPLVLQKEVKAKNIQNSIVLKRFVLYNRQMSETLHARDILTRVKNSITSEINGADSLKLLSNTLKDLPEKTRQIFSGYLETEKFKSMDDLIAHFEIRLKKLHTIMQNIDSLQDNITQNPDSLLKEIENEIKRGNIGQFTINADSAVKLLNT